MNAGRRRARAVLDAERETVLVTPVPPIAPAQRSARPHLLARPNVLIPVGAVAVLGAAIWASGLPR